MSSEPNIYTSSIIKYYNLVNKRIKKIVSLGYEPITTFLIYFDDSNKHVVKFLITEEELSDIIINKNITDEEVRKIRTRIDNSQNIYETLSKYGVTPLLIESYGNEKGVFQFIVTEYYDLDVLTFCRKNQEDVELLKDCINKIIKIIERVVDCKIFCFDIKLDNFVINDKGDIRIIDVDSTCSNETFFDSLLTKIEDKNIVRQIFILINLLLLYNFCLSIEETHIIRNQSLSDCLKEYILKTFSKKYTELLKSIKENITIFPLYFKVILFQFMNRDYEVQPSSTIILERTNENIDKLFNLFNKTTEKTDGKKNKKIRSKNRRKTKSKN